MTSPKSPAGPMPHGFEQNKCSIDTLFSKYEEVGFLYKEKKDLLRPYFLIIKNNWKSLLKSKANILWVLTNKDAKHFSSVSVIKHSNYGLLAQHLISDGNPILSLKLMSYAQYIAEYLNDEKSVKSAQNWFRPNNRYAYRIFASMLSKLGEEKASLISFEYLQQSLSSISDEVVNRYIAKNVDTVDLDLIQFVETQYNSVFCLGEELTYSDVTFSKIGKSYKDVGLNKSRTIIKVVDPNTKNTVGCVIANRAPIGVNFSFLENRAYFILDKGLDESERKKVTALLSLEAKKIYSDFELQAIPIVTDKVTSEVLTDQGAKYIRTYMQSLWLRSGFAQWRQHIVSFLERIDK